MVVEPLEELQFSENPLRKRANEAMLKDNEGFEVKHASRLHRKTQIYSKGMGKSQMEEDIGGVMSQ